jgi:hypothetical protein
MFIVSLFNIWYVLWYLGLYRYVLTVPLIITKTYENFKSARPTPPSILVRFSKKLAHSKIQLLNFRVGAFFRNAVRVPERSRPCRFAAPFLLFTFLEFPVGPPNIECDTQHEYDHLTSYDIKWLPR